MVFPTFFNLHLNLGIRCSWSEPQLGTSHSLVAETVSSFSIFGCKEYNQSDFGVDPLVMSMCRVFSCCWKRVFAMISAFSWQNSISLCPASFHTPRPNLPVTPGVSWLPILHSSPLWWEGHLFRALVLKGLVGLRGNVQLQLLQHYWLGHRLGLPWYWMVWLGNEQRSVCHFWDCIQVLHFGLFCWLWQLLHFF